MDANGAKQYPIMGCYGIGISRTMGVIVEKFNDERGIIWPESVAPFTVQLVSIGAHEEKVRNQADKVYAQLEKEGIEVLYDDRENVGAGQKLADADLIGNPIRLIVSDKTGEKVEWKKRSEDTTELITIEEGIKRLRG